MSKFCMLLLSMIVFCSALNAQTHFELGGVVVNESNEPLQDASVFLTTPKKGTVTDVEGNFYFDHLLIGTYEVKVSIIGYETLIDTIIIKGNTTYKAQLSPSVVNLQEVTITTNHAEMRKKEQSLNIEIVNRDYLRQNLGGSLMGSLKGLPGIGTIDIGSGQSKPIIRGLGFNRVVVVENNIKHEAQQWGTDHGLEIDQYSIDNIEVIKGPASLIYGSDAIGGVIDIKNRRIPIGNSFGGTIDMSYKTNNDLFGTSISLHGRRKLFFAELRATIVDYGDYKVPTDSIDIYSYRAALYKNHLRNTAGKELNFHVTLGFVKKKFQSIFHVSSINNKTGFFANAHGLEPRNVNTDLHDKSNRDIQYPFHFVNHLKVINTSRYQFGLFKLESNFGFQRNFRQERSQYVQHGYMPAVFPDTFSFISDLEREFDKYVFSGNINLSNYINERTLIRFGTSFEHQDNRINGHAFIIPAYNRINMGGFFFAKHQISEKSLVQAGIRYDYGRITSYEYLDWFPSPVIENGDTTKQFLKRAENIYREFSNLTWSLGYNYNAKEWSAKANIGKSFRMPIAKELAANGVNYHHFSYEVGNPEISPESSYQLDVGIEFNSRKLSFGTTPFLNYFLNYIYLNPTSEHDRLYGNGNQVFYYTQSNVLRFGAEIFGRYQLLKSMQIGFKGEYVYSEQLTGEKKGFNLPFSPPASLIFNLSYHKQKLKFVEDAYVSLDLRLTASQFDIVPPEEVTLGHQVINIGLGGKIVVKNQKINVSMQVNNLLNSKYFNHTSYYRLINVPEPARNFVLNISMPFSGQF